MQKILFETCHPAITVRFAEVIEDCKPAVTEQQAKEIVDRITASTQTIPSLNFWMSNIHATVGALGNSSSDAQKIIKMIKEELGEDD